MSTAWPLILGVVGDVSRGSFQAAWKTSFQVSPAANYVSCIYVCSKQNCLVCFNSSHLALNKIV